MRLGVCGLLALGFMTACGAGSGSPVTPDAGDPRDADGESLAEDADCRPEAPPAIAWTALGHFPVDRQGRTAEISVPFEAGLRYLALRTTADPPSPSLGACYRLEPVTLASGAEWVAAPEAQDPQTPVCTLCSQRVTTGHGYGLFVFPNDGGPLPGPDTLRFRVQLRHCAYGVEATATALPDLPENVVVEVAREAEAAVPDAAARASLGIRLATAPGAAVDEATFAAAWAQVERLYAAAGIALRLDAVAHAVGAPSDALRYGPGDMLAADALAADAAAALHVDPAAGARALTVVFVPCLERHDPVTAEVAYPAGQALRIPGGAPTGGYGDAVFVATADCPLFAGEPLPHAWADGAELGLIVAHELGHALGLHHADTTASSHRAPAGPANVMTTTVLSLDPEMATFSAAQADGLRRHPAVWPGPLATCP